VTLSLSAGNTKAFPVRAGPGRKAAREPQPAATVGIRLDNTGRRGGRFVRARPTALAAVLAAALLTGWQAQALAESTPPPAGESGATKPADGGAQPPAAEGGAPKPPEGRVQQKPAEGGGSEGGTPKPAEGGAQKPAEGPKSKYVSILGREATNRDGDGGRVIDVLVGLDGHSTAVVVEFGGFMGIGSRKVAVDWKALRFVREGNKTLLTIDISREQVRDSPEYKANEPPAILTTQ
jgi:hypothetical protein